MLKLVVRRDRRWMWLPLSVLVMAVSIAFSPPVAAQRRPDLHLRVRQTATQSLTLIKPSDSDFQGTLDEYFPGLSEQDGYQNSIRPFLVIVRNDTSQPAIAYAITWTAPNPPGWISPLRAMFVNTPFTYRPSRTSIPPDAIRLISPLFNVTPKEYEATPSFARIYPAAHFPSTKGVVSLKTKVDGVMYKDGSFIGPDSTHILQRYVMARFAARDEALSALEFINSSTAPEIRVAQQLQQSLSQETQRNGRAIQRTLLAMYVRARGQTAGDLQRILRQKGVSGLQTRLQDFVDNSASENASMFDNVYRNLSPTDPRVFGTLPYKPN